MVRTKTNNIDNRICSCCGKPKNEKNYYSSKSKIFIFFQRLPICKDCIDDLFEELLKRTSYNIEKALYYLCMRLDYPFIYSVVEAAKKQTEKTGTLIHRVYIQKINSFGEVNNYGETFIDGEQMNILTAKTDDDILVDDELSQIEIDDDLKIFWGYGFTPKDYVFLELELANWKQTHKCDNHAELTLLKEICIKILDIRNKRASNESTSKEQKELQDLMKTASVDPAKANIASAGKSHDAFGVWVKDIEQFRPAEWFEQQEKYVDMDGFKPYLKNYVYRPIENFLTGIRNFFVDDDIDANLDDVDIDVNEGEFNG